MEIKQELDSLIKAAKEIVKPEKINTEKTKTKN